MCSGVEKDLAVTCVLRLRILESITCNPNYFWTAGQRTDPSTESAFVWKTPDVSEMTYDNWEGANPDFYNSAESCLHILGTAGYRWNDIGCGDSYCYVCEVEL